MKINVSDSNIYEILNESIHVAFENTNLNNFATDTIDFLSLYFNKYVILECTYIGDWSTEQDMVNAMSRIYCNYILVNFNKLKNVKSFQDIKTNVNIPESNTLTITRNTQNDTMTIGEISPITAPTTFPNMNTGETGIDTPNTKNRGRHIANNSDSHTDRNVTDYIKMIEKSRELQCIVEIFDILFRRLIEEYTKLY